MAHNLPHGHTGWSNTDYGCLKLKKQWRWHYIKDRFNLLTTGCWPSRPGLSQIIQFYQWQSDCSLYLKVEMNKKGLVYKMSNIWSEVLFRSVSPLLRVIPQLQKINYFRTSFSADPNSFSFVSSLLLFLLADWCHPLNFGSNLTPDSIPCC